MKRALLLLRGVAAAFVATMLWVAAPIDRGLRIRIADKVRERRRI